MSLILLNSDFEVEKTQTYSWNILADVEKVLGYSWHIHEYVEKTLSYSWTITEWIEKALSYSWEIKGWIERALLYSWITARTVSMVQHEFSSQYEFSSPKRQKTFYIIISNKVE